MLAADCGGAAMAGSVDGQAATLDMKTNAVTVRFAGTLDQAGTTITGKWHFVDGGPEQTGDFTFLQTRLARSAWYCYRTSGRGSAW